MFDVTNKLPVKEIAALGLEAVLEMLEGERRFGSTGMYYHNITKCVGLMTFHLSLAG